MSHSNLILLADFSFENLINMKPNRFNFFQLKVILQKIVRTDMSENGLLQTAATTMNSTGFSGIAQGSTSQNDRQTDKVHRF